MRDLPTDPDAQATVTDFLDYTEYLPSDLVRSLRLIGNLDEYYLASADKVHNMTKVYGSLPSLSPGKRPNPQYLRQEISHNLDHAIDARESSFAEASRLYDQVDRHYNRLTSIISKLHALPKPPSRDPTPVPQARIPQLSRARRTGIDGMQDGTPAPRITLRLGDQKVTGSGRAVNSLPKPRYRSQKVTVPGEVLPPSNPDSPPPATDSEWEFAPPSPVPMATSRVGVPSRNRPGQAARDRVQKSPKPPKLRSLKVIRPPRPPGVMGTNVHSAVAGISTSNALSLLQPPPVDAKPGSSHAPWMRLTEWEMAKLRKRMKKNAIWSPSETMIRRELADAGRGPENYRATKALADDSGEPFLDEDNIATSAPGKPLGPGEISTDSLHVGNSQLSNRGMKLNEAKKQKREMMVREQAALAAANTELAAKQLANVGSSIKSLFPKPVESAPKSPLTAVHQPNGKGTAPGKERVRDRTKERERAKERKEEKERAKEREAEEERERERKKELELELEQERDRQEQRQREQAQEEEARIERVRAEEEEREKVRQKEQEKEIERQKEEEREQQAEKEREAEKHRVLERESAKVPTKKRKRGTSSISRSPEQHLEPMVVVETPTPQKPIIKKAKTGDTQSSSPKTTTTTTITTVPLAPPAPSPPKATLGRPVTPSKEPAPTTATSTRSRRVSLTLKGPAPPQPPVTEPVKTGSRPASRASSRRESAGPPSTPIRATREKLPRTSTTPAPPTPVRTAASRRSKRPAPGPVTEAQEGGPAVSVGKRKAAPKKKGTAAASQAAKKAAEGNAKAKEEESRLEEEAASDDIDPDEPRYCLCGDVSWGDMICCENTEVSLSRPQFMRLIRASTLASKSTLLIQSVTVRKGVVPFRVCEPH